MKLSMVQGSRTLIEKKKKNYKNHCFSGCFIPAKRRLIMKSDMVSSGKLSSSNSLPSTPLLTCVDPAGCLCLSIVLFILLEIMIFSLACQASNCKL